MYHCTHWRKPFLSFSRGWRGSSEDFLAIFRESWPANKKGRTFDCSTPTSNLNSTHAQSSIGDPARRQGQADSIASDFTGSWAVSWPDEVLSLASWMFWEKVPQALTLTQDAVTVNSYKKRSLACLPEALHGTWSSPALADQCWSGDFTLQRHCHYQLCPPSASHLHGRTDPTVGVCACVHIYTCTCMLLGVAAFAN